MRYCSETASVELSPSLSLRDLYYKLCLILVPAVYRPKVLATRATNEPHPIARLQLVEATDGSMIVQLHDVWELGAFARHDALVRPDVRTYTRRTKGANREAEPGRPAGVVCSDLVSLSFVHKSECICTAVCSGEWQGELRTAFGVHPRR